MGLPTELAMIEETERELDFQFPLKWKHALLASNGFDFTAKRDLWQAFSVKDTRSRKHLTRSANHVGRETTVQRSYAHFPPDCIAVASNGSGDVLVIKKGTSNLFIWLHETGKLVDVDEEKFLARVKT